MAKQHPRAVRRRILTLLYERYLENPLEMLSPADLLEDGTLTREDLLSNVHYLHDRGLIELLIGYNPPMFAAARISPNGVDMVENPYEFNLRFPAPMGEMDATLASVPLLVEQLVQEADFCALDGEKRRCLLRDIQYLRDELSRPEERWRREVVATVLGWLAGYFPEEDCGLPSLGKLAATLGFSEKEN